MAAATEVIMDLDRVSLEHRRIGYPQSFRGGRFGVATSKPTDSSLDCWPDNGQVAPGHGRRAADSCQSRAAVA